MKNSVPPEAHVADIRRFHVLEAHCQCSHRADITARVRRYKGGVLLHDIRARLKCDRCGRVGGARLWIGKLPR